ncbi:MAG: response regulator [Hyphomonadaceae bacterium]|nr:MAG: response regulator receiver [Caulobacteraceae bacterium]MBT9447434.1 response regulator [Hyphomonadaceae bacterium]TPW08783.1 MAG: response regulator receiver protein [Alphaproteobacteria bacterium]
MSKRSLDPNRKVNLENVTVLVMDGSSHGLEILSQILAGFGVRTLLRASSLEEARRFTEKAPIDLIVADPDVPGEDGYDFLRDLRRSKRQPNCYVPIVLVTGHTRDSNIKRARDIGANMIVAKPVSSKVLFERILWVAADPRPFVELDHYVGPDRRFKFTGPPPGTDGRREADLPSVVGDAAAPNMSQSEVDTFMKPQKVSL